MFIVPDTSSSWGQQHIQVLEGEGGEGAGYGQNIQTSLLYCTLYIRVELIMHIINILIQNVLRQNVLRQNVLRQNVPRQNFSRTKRPTLKMYHGQNDPRDKMSLVTNVPVDK